MNKFEFDSVDDFDKHIDLSIPNYKFLLEHIKYMIDALSEDYTNILDLGCSTGNLLKSIDKREDCNYFGYDISEIMPKESFDNNLFFENKNISKEELIENCSIISSIFTLQFLPSNKRKNVIKKVYDSLNDGGHFIVCEKVHSPDPLLENITNSIYYRFKSKNFSANEILEKQQKLANSMKLKTTNEIFDELSDFKYKEIFWKSYGFVGFIARK
jgi:tRNA (cmo5U34)-methyltransferase